MYSLYLRKKKKKERIDVSQNKILKYSWTNVAISVPILITNVYTGKCPKLILPKKKSQGVPIDIEACDNYDNMTFFCIYTLASIFIMVSIKKQIASIEKW